MRTRLCLPQGHCGSSRRLGLYSRVSPTSLPASRREPWVLVPGCHPPKPGQNLPTALGAAMLLESGRGSRPWMGSKS